jgi:hypothetical protein
LENYIGTDDCQCRHIQGTRSYACRNKQGSTTRDVWRTGLAPENGQRYSRGATQTEVVITEFNRVLTR